MTRTVVHVIPGLGVGGAERMLIKLLGRAHDPTMVHRVVSLRAGGELRSEMEAVAGPIVEIGIDGSFPGPASAWKLRAEVRRLEPSLVVGWMYHGNLAARFARQGRPMIWNIRQSIYGWRHFKPATTLTIRAGALLSRSAQAIVYNSRTAAGQHAALGYADERALVLPNGFDVGRFTTTPRGRESARRLLEVPEGTTVIGMVARVHPFKGHDDFMRAAELVARKRDAVSFVLVGTGTEEYLAEWRRGHPEARVDVRALGEVRDVSTVFPGIDLVVSSSVTEGFPNAVGEAMACGIPCVVTDVGDCAFLVGDAGVVVPPSAPAALAEGVERLLALPSEERSKIGARARSRVEGEFDLPRIADRYFELYDRVLREWEGGDGAR